MAAQVDVKKFGYLEKMKNKPRNPTKESEGNNTQQETHANEELTVSKVSMQSINQIFNLTKKEADFLNDSKDNNLSYKDMLEQAMSSQLSNSEMPFLIDIQESKNTFGQSTPLQDEFFPESSQKHFKNDEELNPESAEYQAKMLGPLESRLSKKSKSHAGLKPISERQSRQFKKLDELKEEAANTSTDELSEIDKALMTQLPSSNNADDYISENPKDICPVDLDENENGEIIPFFNLDRTFASWGHPEWSSAIKIPAEKFESQAWQNIAKKQYQKYLAYQELSQEQKNSQADKIKKLKILIPVVAGVLVLLLGAASIIPKITMGNGMSELDSGNYQAAYKIFCEKGTNKYYCAYTEVQLFMEEHKYTEAIEKLDILEKYQDNVKYDLKETRNEVLYQQGLYLISEKKYAQGLNILKTISNYKDVPTVYYDTCYRVGNEYAETNKEISLRYFYMANDYKDSKEKFEQMATDLYNEGLASYYSGNYEKAQEQFNSLQGFSFRDAKLMTTQCIYRAGLDAYLNEDYKTSNLYFKQIPWFKDSSALLYEDELLMTEEEKEEQIKALKQDHPDWIMSYEQDTDNIKIVLYNGEIFKYNLADVSSAELDKFIEGHGSQEAIKLAILYGNYRLKYSSRESEAGSEFAVELTTEQIEKLREHGSFEEDGVTYSYGEGITIIDENGVMYDTKKLEDGTLSIEKRGE